MVLPREMPQKASVHKIGQYDLTKKFLGYRAKEDPTMLPKGTLVSPSRNVVINSSGRVATVPGYILDGAASAVADSGILSNFDFINFKGDVRNLRAGFLTTAANDGRLEYRYLTGAGTTLSPYVVNWVTLMSGLTNVRMSYCEYWDTTALVKNVLWVDGTNNIFAWNGAVTTVASATATTVTKQGTTTWAQEGFAQAGAARAIVINGVSATYTGGEGTTTLTGVSVDFSATAAGAITHQLPVTTTLASMTSILATFGPTVIGCGRRNQVYVGASNSNTLYISKVNSYTDYSFTTPVRVVGEGVLLQLDSSPTGFIPLEDRQDTKTYDMYISEGLSTWSVIQATLSADLTKETLEHTRMKVAYLQGAKSGRLMGKMKNHIMFVGNDNVSNFMGLSSYQDIPEMTDFSFPVIDDMSTYDFTDGSIFYHKNYVYEAIPKHGIIRAYNMTDQTKQSTQSPSYFKVEEVDSNQPFFWEAPLGIPVSGFYVTPDKGLCGHSYTSSESYELFTGGSFNGQDIDANATFSLDDKDDRTQSKGSTEIYVEGYIKQNTTINVDVSGDLDAEMVTQTVTIVGNDSSIVAFGAGAHSLGKNNLGSQPLGGAQLTAPTRPAWFHAIKTYDESSFYLEQLAFYTKGVDLGWELLCFGTNAEFTNEGNNSITE